ncbi:MAG: prenyltransferase, partial [Acidimicrobiales bacterium]
VQLRSGMIPWFEGGHADPWNHVEAAMALDCAGLGREAEAAYAWLAGAQRRDGSWCAYYLAEGVEEPRRDTNFCAYVATGAWHHWLVSSDRGFLEEMWPTVEAAIGFVLGHQLASGEVSWAVDPDGSRGGFALLTGSSSICHSIRCAVSVAGELGLERPAWELSAARLARCIALRPERFAPKDRWAMDWYYPVLAGVLRGAPARRRMVDRWQAFVLEGLGVRCVSDRPWATAAETAECVLALDAAGMGDEARSLFAALAGFRQADGSYLTGLVHPQRRSFPGGERSTYSAAAVVLAATALGRRDRAASLFRGCELDPVGVGDARG